MVAGAIRRREPASVGDEALRQAMYKIREDNARRQDHDYSHVFRKKSKFDLIRLSCIILGIEFAYAAETAFVSPTLLEIGIEHKHMTMVWSLSPFLGFFLAPLMGSLSDRCRLKWGRRRPLIFILSCFLLTGLLLVPWGKDIGQLLGDSKQIVNTKLLENLIEIGENVTVLEKLVSSTAGPAVALGGDGIVESGFLYKWAIIVTILGTILLDFSADTCQTPARTYLLDICISEDQTRGLSIFTVMAGMGGFMGYSLGGINWEKTIIGDFMGGNVKTVFTIVTVLFFISCSITLFSFREIPLPLMEQDELLRPISTASIKKELIRNNNATYIVKEKTNNTNLLEYKDSEQRTITLDLEMQSSKSTIDDDEADDVISLGEYLKSIIAMPKSFRILCFTNLLSWMAHVSYCLYFTDFVGEIVFLGNPMGGADSQDLLLYQAGVRFGCWGMAIYALSCSIYSMAIERLIHIFGAKLLYIGGLLIFGVGMLSLVTFPTKIGVLLFSIPAGILYATVFTIPYLLIANYHGTGSVKNGENVPLKQTRGLGTDVAVLGSMMFVAQIIISLCIGPLITLIGSTSAVIYTASALGLLAAIAASQVLYMDL